MDTYTNIINELTDVRKKNISFLESFERALKISCLDAKDLSLEQKELILAGKNIISEAVEFNKTKTNPFYHNYQHFSEAVISAAFLGKEEFKDVSNREQYITILLVSMIGHDLFHEGTTNKTGEASNEEKSAIAVLNIFNKKNKSGDMVYPNISKDVKRQIAEIILGTEFGCAAKENKENYSFDKPLEQLKLLANEADVLVSCLPHCGPDMGILLGKELAAISHPFANMVSSWEGRELFLKQGAGNFISKASLNLGIEKLRLEELKSIEFFGAKELDKISQLAGGFEKTKKMVLEQMLSCNNRKKLTY